MAIIDSQLVGQYSTLHHSREYGTSASEFATQIQACIHDLRPETVLEYGCGQSTLRHELELPGGRFHRYDPAIPELSALPVTSADLIVNTDVLEHIPERDLPDVLGHMRSISPNVFFNIATRAASQLLEDGSTGHCTSKSGSEWIEIIRARFPDAGIAFERVGHSCLILTWQSPVLRIVSELERAKEIESRHRSLAEAPWTRAVRKGRRAIRQLVLAH